MSTSSIVICGAGIAGIAAAYELAVVRGLRDVVLVEQGDPLALTSDKSTEAYRVWWPGPDDAFVRLVARSVDRLEAIAQQTANLIQLNRRGYLYATADIARLADFEAEATAIAALGAGPLRVHLSGGADYRPAPAHNFAEQPAGADLLLDRDFIRARFPYLSEHIVALLHVRRAGWFSARQLGMWMLEEARAAGVRLLRGQLNAIALKGGRVQGVTVGTQQLATACLISAAGPLQGDVARMLGLELPLVNELHLKLAFNDQLGTVPRDAPLLIWNDPVRLAWNEEERAELAADPDLRWLLEALPAGVHARPEGGTDANTLLLLWDYHTAPSEPHFPIALDEQLTEIALRGMATMVPALAAYLRNVPRAYIDGGYYTRTPENRPLIGPLTIAGAYIIGALSGYGVMAACAAAELLADYITGAALPDYAAAFHPARYNDPAYQRLVERWGATGQL